MLNPDYGKRYKCIIRSYRDCPTSRVYPFTSDTAAGREITSPHNNVDFNTPFYSFPSPPPSTDFAYYLRNRFRRFRKIIGITGLSLHPSSGQIATPNFPFDEHFLGRHFTLYLSFHTFVIKGRKMRKSVIK